MSPAPSSSAAPTAIRLTIAANFVAEPIASPLQVLLRDLRLEATAQFAPYDQVIQQLLDPQSELRRATHGIILLQLERWMPAVREDIATLHRNVWDFADALRAAARGSGIPFLVIACPVSPEYQHDPKLRPLEDMLRQRLTGCLGIEFVGNTDREALYPPPSHASLFDRYSEKVAQIPYSPLSFATLATLIARRLFAYYSPPKKVIVVDCDNTLWNGECGEIGGANVTIGAGRKAFQQLLLKQLANGRLVCVCSKNEEYNAIDVFVHHPEMLLRKEHLTSWRIDWQPKADNLRALSTELSLSLDSFIFIDDDTFECEAMRAVHPDVLTLQLPRDETEIGPYLRDVWELDLRPVTAEDRQRTQFYRENAERERARSATTSLAEFVDSLQLRVSIDPLSSDDLARAAQLTERTNQFNLNGIRRSIAEIERLLANPATMCRLVRASDRFGDYGAIGLLIYHAADEILEVETLLLSCRALGKGVEAQLAIHLLQAGAAAGVEEIQFAYRKTQKNGLVLPFLTLMGAKQSWGRWVRRRPGAPPPHELAESGQRPVLITSTE